jgi:cyclic pyranopterin phosphate synthase
VGTLNDWRMDAVVPADEIVSMIDAEMPLEPVPPSYPGEVATRYRYVDGSGEIGVISSVTKPFCGECTRLRLSPEGELYTCLFGSTGIDLRTHLRDGTSDDDLEKIVRQVWIARLDRYSEERTALTKPRPDKVEMYHIGG